MESATTAQSTTTQGHCMKCRAKRDIKDPQDIVMKNGRHAVQGACSVCGTKIFKIKAGKKAPTAPAESAPEPATEPAT